MLIKRLLSAVLCAVMLLSTFAVGMTVQAKLPFNDTDGHWGESAIEYVVDAGLMNGVGNGTSFAPNMSLTRGMVVTVLYRDNGSPKQPFKSTFLDVAEGAYYSAATEWAYANGIVNGTGTNDWGEPYFSPDRDITRQELATMFARYADFKDVDTTADNADISTFPDNASVADWARDAVKWAVGTGLITGKGGSGAATLSPVDKAVRAEFATIIKRFKEADFTYHLVYNEPVTGKFTDLKYPLVNDADLYVSVDGSDTNPGTLDKPLATFAEARLKVRELKKTAKDEIVVAFKAGDYGILTETFTAEDAGTKDIPVKYCAYGDGDVVFTNGFDISADEFESLSDSDKKFFTASTAGDIKKVYIGDRLSDEVDISTAYLFSENGFCNFARYPNKGVVDTYLSNFFEKAGDKAIKILVTKDRIDKYHTFDGVQVIGHFMYEWDTSNMDVVSYDKATGIFELSGGLSYGISDDKSQIKVYINNVSEELDAAGEFWVDTATDTLYVYKPEGNYTLATHGTFVDMQHSDFVTFEQLNFKATTAKAMHIYADDVKLSYCDISFVAGDIMIRFDNSGVEGCVVEGCNFSYLAGSGIRIDGHSPELYNDRNKFINNSFDNYCIVYASGKGLHINNCFGTVVAHNEFTNSPRTGLDVYGCINCIIEYNVLDNVMTNSGDGGALYFGGTYRGRGNIVRYNVFKNIKQGSGIFTIYLDDGTSGQILYSNIFYNAGDYSVMIAGGRDNKLYDNITISSSERRKGFWTFDKYYTMYQGGELSDSHYEHITSDYFGIRNSTDPKVHEFFNANFPEIYTTLLTFEDYKDPDCVINPNNYYSKNYVFGTKHLITESALECSTLIDNKDNISIEVNEFFVNPTLGDYSLLDGVDFADNHFAKIGRY